MEHSKFDPSMNILHRPYQELDAVFSPKVVAVIGASEREHSVGRTLITNLLKTPFGGVIFPVNPKRSSIMGLKAYPNIATIPERIDLGIIVTPAKTVASLVRECAQAKVRSLVIISAGFKEMGEPGQKLEQEIMEIASESNIRIIGPNCLGVMNPILGLNATFAADIAHPGNLAFISQSGALLTAVLDWSLEQKVGFSSIVSIGSMIDISWGDLIDYFGSDSATKSILIYMESIGDPRSFLSAAREVALNKPIILIKAGKSEESAKAAASHTGALAGSDDVLNAALARAGVLRVDTIADLFSMADILSKQPRSKGPHLSIVTNAGGPGVIATDALIENQGALSELGEKSFAAFDALLPPQWSRNNPIDILGDASPETYAQAVKIAQESDESDGTLVILTPQDMTDPTACAEHLATQADGKKPLFASWMGGSMVQEGIQILNQAKIPSFEYPDEAAKAFAYMWRYAHNLESLYETPQKSDELPYSKVEERTEFIQKTLQKARAEKRTILTEYEAKKLLRFYGIDVAETLVGSSVKEAQEHAQAIGFPVVLKLHSSTITHKSDVGGVQLNLKTLEDVAHAYERIEKNVAAKATKEDFQGVSVQPMISLEGYELILGSSVDPEFGPTILFGLGGQLVEVFQDRALALPPLTSTLATRMMEQTKIYRALQGVRGKAALPLDKLASLLVRFSHIISQEPWIKECDINPLLVNEERMIALDARIVLYEEQENRHPLAIRPYPVEWISAQGLDTNVMLHIRPVLPEDIPDILQFHRQLSETSLRLRYAQSLQYDEDTTMARVRQMCFSDYERDITLLALVGDEVVGVVRLSKIPGSKNALLTMMVKDERQNQGIGSALMESILAIAKQENIQLVLAELLEENEQMHALVRKFSFTIEKTQEYLLAKKYCDQLP
ncbi:MAG: bifunctional acetate--CoA ligase family protein/GNAT family N-acetyltransferase [Chlamydiota bacterium]